MLSVIFIMCHGHGNAFEISDTGHENAGQPYGNYTNFGEN